MSNVKYHNLLKEDNLLLLTNTDLMIYEKLKIKQISG
jgi:hypothetical protein